MSMTSYVPETTARDLPMLPIEPWTGEDTDDEMFESVTAAVPREYLDTLHAVPPAPGAAGPAAPSPAPSPAADPSSGDRNTVPGLRKPKSARRLPLPADASSSTPTPIPPPAAARGHDAQRLPLPPAVTGVHAVPRPPSLRRSPSLPPPPSLPPRPGSGGSRPSTRGAPPPGKTVAGRYEILERIGQGGMGKVYKVSHAQLGKTFALKVIGENLAETDDARELFYREARLASSVNHPNITSVVDFGEDDALGVFMVMELVEGEPLAKMLHRETRLGVRVACEIILQVADALHYVHGKGIVHCDIKTENILVSEQQSTKRRQLIVKLLDFGLARSLASGRGSGPLSGTPHYVAPERIKGDAASPASDIYALGILFYEIVTGHVPWDGPVSQILNGHLDEIPTPPSKLVPGGLDPALENLILRALAKTPAERHRDMAAFIYELRTVMDMLGFGRRGRRGGGPGKRVVIERSKNERDALVARAFESCRLPLALVTPQGLVLVSNTAFARFVMGVAVEVEGLTVQSTPLASAWEAFESDLGKAVGGSSVRRILEIAVEDRPSQRLLMWLDPAGDGNVLLGVQPIEIT
jgi:tRNA A-37 threonylcarbamoyl transferase component Bud32